ncbi:hypothetical protein E4U13_007786 [Claviceps humidiphila]|uniref:Uncharacterized protein n=1 Tax=Claviceps humidiphila TaxID=1294629 RepID=A0A9P7TRC6_9HYPO|nr:hypothetical protein E4U13_007786 [Claviceps humidiphila]
MESATTLTLPRGFVDTTATDGRRLRIYYIRETPVDAEDDNDINSRTTATHATSSTTIDVSKEAVNIAKLLRGGIYQGRPRFERASHHTSTYTPLEERHITVDVSSEESWAEGMGFARTGIHVFSVNDVVAMGYKNYDRKKCQRRSNYDRGEIANQLEEARSRDLKDECQGL